MQYFPRQSGVPRKKETYRGFRRQVKISWNGVETKRIESPSLIKKTSKKGEIYYVTDNKVSWQ